MNRKEILKRLIRQAEVKQLIDDTSADDQDANVGDYAEKFMHNLIENTKIEGLED